VVYLRKDEGFGLPAAAGNDRQGARALGMRPLIRWWRRRQAMTQANENPSLCCRLEKRGANCRAYSGIASNDEGVARIGEAGRAI
jgi:hypothetical protein